jgi:hypothetical protein
MTKRQAEEIFNILDSEDHTELAVEWGLYFEREQWHPWPEEKPLCRGTYLVFNKNDKEEPLAAQYDTPVEPGGWEYLGWMVTITHWRELPPGPEDVS